MIRSKIAETGGVAKNDSDSDLNTGDDFGPRPHSKAMVNQVVKQNSHALSPTVSDVTSTPNSLLPPNPAHTKEPPLDDILMNVTDSPRTASFSARTTQIGTFTLHSPLPLPPSAVAASSRKTRFAPLPEPRRYVAVDKNGTETPHLYTYPSTIALPLARSPETSMSVALNITNSLRKSANRPRANWLAHRRAIGKAESDLSKKKLNLLFRVFGMRSSSTPKRNLIPSLPTDRIVGLGLGLGRKKREGVSYHVI
ncbi:hypothetical protein FRC12_011833 [Ceratobasidium sp. 428]|nr:hypothetical protein FRC12_011833 [Ceratobasidium sp. 428]